MFRKFYLMNNQNERYELTDINFKTFLADPKGLGFSKTYSVVRLGNKDLVTSEQFNLLTPSGELYFYGNSNAERYSDYHKFMQYITKTPIHLYYKTPDTNEPYFCEVNIIQVDKTEVDDGILKCPIQFKMLSFWQTAKTNELEVRQDVGVGKFYELERKINEGYFYGGSNLNNLKIYNNGTIQTGLIIEIFGEVENPQINFYQNGTQYGVVKLNGLFDYVRINSIDDDEDIHLEYKGSVLANPLSYQDLSVGGGYVTFVKLMTGETELTISASDNIEGHVKFTWRDNYVSI